MTREEYMNKMRPELEALRNLQNPPRIYVIATGGCSQLQSTLWQIPGASAYLVGAQFPYAQEATRDVLGYTPEHFVDRSTAFALAHKAYYNALAQATPETAVGVGITCSVASLKEHRGQHHAWIALVSRNIETSLHLIYGKSTGEQSRLEDDFHIEVATLSLILNVCAKTRVQDPADYEASRKALLSYPFIATRGDRYTSVQGANSDIVFLPGSFNPPHVGHANLAKAAQLRSGRRVVYTIVVDPVHKAHLTVPEMIVRMRAMTPGAELLFTESDPLFIDKARKYPGAAFAIGADTCDRFLDPKWTPGRTVEDMLHEFMQLGTKFYVSSRLVGDRYMNVHEVIQKRGVDNNFLSLFWHVDVPRIDISSTQLRERV